MELTGLLAAASASEAGDPEDLIDSALETMRLHLGMEIAYLSEFVGDRVEFRYFRAPGLDHLAPPRDGIAQVESYCRHIIDGRLPPVIPDMAKEPLALALPYTQAAQIRSLVSIPLRRPDGTVFGMFGCLSRTPNPSLNERDLAVMRLFAKLSGDQLLQALTFRCRRAEIAAQTRAALDRDGFTIHFQPICSLSDRRAGAFEALCRFSGAPYRSPDIWFSEAHEIGMGAELEIAAASMAAHLGRAFPPDIQISINASSEALADTRLLNALRSIAPEQTVVEITEHSVMQNCERFHRTLGLLRAAGVRLAIDDVGAGYAGLSRILSLEPDILKLDMELVRDVDRDPARCALVGALVAFAQQTGALLIAEGVETEAELRMLHALGVPLGQGWHLGRPGDLDTALAMVGPAQRTA